MWQIYRLGWLLSFDWYPVNQVANFLHRRCYFNTQYYLSCRLLINADFQSPEMRKLTENLWRKAKQNSKTDKKLMVILVTLKISFSNDRSSFCCQLLFSRKNQHNDHHNHSSDCFNSNDDNGRMMAVIMMIILWGFSRS